MVAKFLLLFNSETTGYCVKKNLQKSNKISGSIKMKLIKWSRPLHAHKLRDESETAHTDFGK